MRDGTLTFHDDRIGLRFAVPSSSEPATRAALLAELDRYDPEETVRITFSGGSPLEHPEFDNLVQECRRRDFERLALTTDGAPLAEDGVLDRLQADGFEHVQIVCGGIREPVYDRMIRKAGTFKRAMQGIHNALRSDLRAYVVVPVARANRRDIEPLLDWLLAQPAPPTGFLLDVPEAGRIHSGLYPLLLPHRQIAQIAERVFTTAHNNRVEYGFVSKRSLSACAGSGVLDRFGTVFHDRVTFFRTRDEKVERIAACDDCSLENSCAGIEPAHLAAFGTQDLRPVPLDVSMAWKLRTLNRLDHVDFKNVSPFKTDSARQQRTLLRINGHCNMSCAFCFVDRTVADFDAEQLEGDIHEFRKSGGEHLVLSGGEPTLHPDLARLIAHGKKLGFRTIEIQTNGVKTADPEYAKSLVDAGLNKVTVSLHSVDAEHSDKITRLPKAFGKSIQSIHNFRPLGVVTQIAHVITKSNYQELPKTFRFFSETFPEKGGHLSVCVAIAQGISDLVYTWVVPSFTEIKPFVKEALDHAQAHGIGFGGMIGQGGYPPCMLDGELKYYEGVYDRVYLSDDFDDQFYKAERCAECSFTSRCIGVRKAYVEAYGDEELRPFQADVSKVAPLAELARPGQRLVQLRAKETAAPSVPRP